MANAERNPQRKIQVDVKRSSENGTLVVTTAFPQEIRKRAYLTEKDALDTVGEKRSIFSLFSYNPCIPARIFPPKLSPPGGSRIY